MTHTSDLGLNQSLSYFLLDVKLVTKFNFHSPLNKLIEYCKYFFLVSLDAMMRGVDFLNVFCAKIKNLQTKEKLS